MLANRIKHMTASLDPLPEWIELQPNNHGFWSTVDYPYRSDPNEVYTIGVFGGSVAQWLAVQGGEYLENEVARIPELRGRRVQIVNLALGGYKQPQQVHTLAYFIAIGQRFDLVLNVDGFNEVALPYTDNAPKNVHHSLPRAYPRSVAAVSSLADASTIAWLYRGQSLKRSARYWDEKSRQRFSAALYLMASRLSLIFKSLLQDHASKMPAASEAEKTAFFTLKGEPDQGKVEAHLLIDLWADSSLLMRSLAESHGAHYIHVLQPNQYHSGKTFSNEEKRIAYNPNHPYAKPVRLFYPALIKESRSLVDKGVTFIDASSIFDDVEEVIYADACCHYNDQGNHLLVDAIVSRLARELSLQE